MRHAPHRGVRLGNNVYLGVGVVIDVPAGAELTIGDEAKVMHYVVIAAAKSVSIGAYSQIGEHSSVRDANHDMTAGASMHTAPVVAEPVRLGVDVWVGRGCAVLAGSVIGDGAVVGANSVTRGEIPAGAVAVGAPARVVRNR